MSFKRRSGAQIHELSGSPAKSGPVTSTFENRFPLFFVR